MQTNELCALEAKARALEAEYLPAFDGIDAVITGVSGGADSMALLFYLVRRLENTGVKLVCVHINHMLRGDESDRDEQFVYDQCALLGIDCIVRRADIQTLSRSEKTGIEECARRIRYSCFNEIAGTYKHALIATAHTASDHAETVLFNLTRGTGLKGLSGIPKMRRSGSAAIIRPLLSCSRADVLDYLDSNHVPFIHDSSNDCDLYSRNRIRHHVIPALKQINTAFEETVLRQSGVIAAEDRYLDKVAKEALDDCMDANGQLPVSCVRALDTAIARRVLRLYAAGAGSMLEHTHISVLLRLLQTGSSGQSVALPGGISARLSFGSLLLDPDPPSAIEPFVISKISLPRIIRLPGRCVVLDVSANKDPIVHKKDIIALLDYDKITESFLLRGRAEGDRLQIPRRNGTKTLKKLYIEHKIDQHLRNGLFVLVQSDNKTLLCSEAFGVDAHFAVTEKTAQILAVSVVKAKEPAG